MSILSFTVVGAPAPQGSKRHVGRGVMVESSKKVAPWRHDVKAAATAERARTGHASFTGPVAVTVVFYLRRPKSHYRTGANADLLRQPSVLYVATKPDVDKLVRSTFDALGEAGVYRDDSQVVRVTASKCYAGDFVGCTVTVEDIA